MTHVFLASTFVAHLLFSQAATHQTLPEAASILDRYAHVTTEGAPNSSKKLEILTIEYSVTDSAGAVYYATVYRDRSGHLHTEVVDDPDQREWGVAAGRAWSSSKQGAHLQDSKVSERLLAETKGWSAGSLGAFAAGWGGSVQAEDWRMAFPTVTTVGRATVHNEPCFEVLVTRTDGSTLRRWYEVKSGLLAREITTEFDQNGVEKTYETEVDKYETWVGVTYPAVLKIKSGQELFTVKLNSLARGFVGNREAFELTRDVTKALSQANTPAGMPNAVDLFEHFTRMTGSSAEAGQQAPRSEVMKANLSMADANLKVPLVIYAAGRKSYLSLDVPTMGKFEFGSNGEVSWQRSVVMGPEILGHAPTTSLLGPDIAGMLSWAAQDMDLRTVGKDDLNGTACYVVEMSGGKPDGKTKIYFDAKTGYLLRMDTPAAKPSAPAEVMTFADYRMENGFLVAHHVETMLGGKPVTIEVMEVTFNIPLPERVFNLPADVAELLEHQQETEKKPADGNSSERPTLRRSNPQ